MEQIDLNQFVQIAPALAVLMWLNVQQMRQINRLLSIVARCCDDDDDKEIAAALGE